jgi:hypothetical protein
VVKIVRGFLALSGTRNQCGCEGVSLARFEAAEDEYAKGYMTPDGGFIDETRGNKAPAPPAPASARPAPAPVDLSEIGRIEKALRSEDDDLNNAIILSLSGTSDAKAIEKLSAIEVVTETPPDIKAAAAKAFAEPDAEDDIEVGLEVRSEDRSAAAKAELAAALEDARLAQGSPEMVIYEVGTDEVANPVKGGRQEGGAAGTSAVALDIKIWDECPAGVDPAQRQTAIDAAKAKVGDNPSQIVVYIGHPGAMQKQDIVKKDANYAPYALTYISAYDADNILLKRAAKGLRWDRAPGQLRLQRIDVDLSNLPKEQSVVKSIIVEFGPEIPCLLIPKFQKTVSTAGVKEGVNAMIDILKGLCIERNFVIDDLHIGNMAIMNGKGVTFDYDRLVEKDPVYELFKGKLQEIHKFNEQYGSLEQFEHAFRLYNDIVKEPALTARYFCIYDLLSVLASLKVLARAAGKEGYVTSCEDALKGSAGDTFEGRTAAVNALVAALKDVAWANTTVVKVFDAPPPPGASGPIRRPPGSLARATASPAGGRRTPRRKGLPQLL